MSCISVFEINNQIIRSLNRYSPPKNTFSPNTEADSHAGQFFNDDKKIKIIRASFPLTVCN